MQLILDSGAEQGFSRLAWCTIDVMLFTMSVIFWTHGVSV
jgi:hypothetical protein